VPAPWFIGNSGFLRLSKLFVAVKATGRSNRVALSGAAEGGGRHMGKLSAAEPACVEG
jgi:hypothetical protein